MQNMKLWSILILSVSVTFFEQGCTVAQRKEILDEAYAEASKLVKAEATKVAQGAEAYVNAKLDVAKKAKLEDLDKSLAELTKVDPATGQAATTELKTWKDFDENKDGDLNEMEIAKCGAYITKTLAGAAATGKISGERAKNIGGSVASVLVLLLLFAAGKRGTGALANVFKGRVTPKA